MKIINQDKSELVNILRKNYAMRAKERVCMEHNAIIILYDDKYDSERRPIPYKPVM